MRGYFISKMPVRQINRLHANLTIYVIPSMDLCLTCMHYDNSPVYHVETGPDNYLSTGGLSEISSSFILLLV